MCDTLSITSNWSVDGVAYFAKNSDRSANEPHLVLRVPPAEHGAGEKLRCTYIEIPQAEYTREMILYKPSWIWGAEMGVNSSRVAIGNEAVFTKTKRGKPALTGMDLLRLALERADTAEKAVEVIIELLERFGQGGNCGFDHEFYYDNSFLAADPNETFVIETAGKNYALRRVEDRYAISNRLSIGTEHTSRSGLNAGEDFSKRFTEPVYSHFSGARQRRCSIIDKLSPSSGAEELMSVLRNHDPKVSGREFTRGSVKSVCMHAGGLVGDHTTGSLVASLRSEKPITLWSTGASTPCISAFKPVFWGGSIPPVFENAEECKIYWLKREQLHRAVLAGKVDVETLRGKIRALESHWIKKERELMSADAPDIEKLYDLSREANAQEQALIDELYTEDWQAIKGGGRFAGYWRRKNGALGQS